MFSGKTTHLLRDLASRPAGTCAAFKPTVDDRYQRDAIVSHDGVAHPARAIECITEVLEHIRQVRVSNIAGSASRETPLPHGRGSVLSDASRLRAVIIDEVHFFGDAIVDVADELGGRGLDVLLAGLDVDRWGQPFPHMERLSSLATHVICKQADCARCGAPARRTQRTRPIGDAPLVGGAECYEPRCIACWTPPPVAQLA